MHILNNKVQWFCIVCLYSPGSLHVHIGQCGPFGKTNAMQARAGPSHYFRRFSTFSVVT